MFVIEGMIFFRNALLAAHAQPRVQLVPAYWARSEYTFWVPPIFQTPMESSVEILTHLQQSLPFKDPASLAQLGTHAQLEAMKTPSGIKFSHLVVVSGDLLKSAFGTVIVAEMTSWYLLDAFRSATLEGAPSPTPALELL